PLSVTYASEEFPFPGNCLGKATSIRARRMPVVASIFEDQIGVSAIPLDEVAPTSIDSALPTEANQMLRSMERALGQSFTVIECGTGLTLRAAADGLRVDLYTRLASCEQVAQRGQPEILDEVSPLLLLAVPLPATGASSSMVAVATFLTERVASEEQIAAAASEFGVEVGEVFRWAESQTPWPPKAIQELSCATAEKTAVQQSTVQIKRQLGDI